MQVKVSFPTSPTCHRITPSSKIKHLKSLPTCLSDPRQKKKKETWVNYGEQPSTSLYCKWGGCLTDYAQKINASRNRAMAAKCLGIRSWAKVLQKCFYLKKALSRTFTSLRLVLCCLIKIIIFKTTTQIIQEQLVIHFKHFFWQQNIHPSKQHLHLY